MLIQPAVEYLLEQRLSPGIVVLASPLRLVYMNRSAEKLIERVNEADRALGSLKPEKVLLPASLRQICLEIFEHMRGQPRVKDRERIEMKRFVGCPTEPVLVRAFGVPGGRKSSSRRVILLLEDIAKRGEALVQVAMQRYDLTERERAVLGCLSKGWTNRQIASELKLAVPTVKEHIKHIMEKTHTSTRTGIVLQILAG